MHKNLQHRLSAGSAQAQHSSTTQHKLSTGSAQLSTGAAQQHNSAQAQHKLSTSSAQLSRKQFYLESFVNSSNGGLRAAQGGRNHMPTCIYD